MAWWRQGSIGLLGTLLALTACGSSTPPSTTVVSPLASTTRPAGFGGTLPAATTALTVTPTTLAVSTTAVSTTDEAALRARVLEYDRAFREELLHEPEPNFERLLRYFPSSTAKEAVLSQLIEDIRLGKTYELNSPDHYVVKIESLNEKSVGQYDVTVCVEDNIVSKLPSETESGVAANRSLSSIRYVNRWRLAGSWVLSGGISEQKIGQGALC